MAAGFRFRKPWRTDATDWKTCGRGSRNLAAGLTWNHSRGKEPSSIFACRCRRPCRMTAAKSGSLLNMAIKVCIVEDSATFRNTLADFINSTPDVRCVCACESGTEALEQIPKRGAEVVLMDIQLPDISGIECTFRLKS